MVVPSSTMSPSTWKNSERVAGVDRLVPEAAPRQQRADRRLRRRASPGSGRATCASAAGAPRRRRRACPTGRAPGGRAGCSASGSCGGRPRPRAPRTPRTRTGRRSRAISRDRLVDRMQRAAADRAAGRRDVDGLGAEARRRARWSRSPPPRAASAASMATRTALATAPTRGRSSAGSPPMPAQHRGQAALLAEHFELDRLERGRVGAVGDRAPASRRAAPRGRASGRSGSGPRRPFVLGESRSPRRL